jgi:hypothetical protein
MNIEQIKKIGDTMAGKAWAFCAENDCYAATMDGQIYRVCRRQKSKAGKILSLYETVKLNGSTDKYGYTVYRMIIGGKKRHAKGHRLVLGAFIGAMPGMVVNHKDGNKKNNQLSNLEWVTVAENNRHAIDNGLFDPRKPNPKNAKVQRYDYVSIYLQHKEAGIPRTTIAKNNRVSRSTIDNVIKSVGKVMLEVEHANS